jgi:hypothetical protein
MTEEVKVTVEEDEEVNKDTKIVSHDELEIRVMINMYLQGYVQKDDYFKFLNDKKTLFQNRNARLRNIGIRKGRDLDLIQLVNTQLEL